MADDWVPLWVRVSGDDARASYFRTREEIGPGLLYEFGTFLRATTYTEARVGSPPRPHTKIWATIQRITELPVFPIESVEEVLQRPPLELLSVVDAVLTIAPPHVLRVATGSLFGAMAEARFAWTLKVDGEAAFVARRLSPGVEAAVSAATKSQAAREHLLAALKLATGTKPHPAHAAAAAQKALEAAVIAHFPWANGQQLGKVVGEIRSGRQAIALRLPRGPMADTKKPSIPKPSEFALAVLDAVHFGNTQRHATDDEQDPLTPDDALSLLYLASLAIDWLERGLLTST